MNKVNLTVISRTYSVVYNNIEYLVTTDFYCNEENRTWKVYENNEDLVENNIIYDEVVRYVKNSHDIKGCKM